MAESAQFILPNALSEVRRSVSPGQCPPCGHKGQLNPGPRLRKSLRVMTLSRQNPQVARGEVISSIGFTWDIPVPCLDCFCKPVDEDSKCIAYFFLDQRTSFS